MRGGTTTTRGDLRALRLAVLCPLEEGGATVAARETLAWAPGRGHVVRSFPGRAGETAPELLESLEAFAPDLVHVHCWYRAFAYDVLGAVAARFPVVLTLHDVFPVNQYGVECWECYRNPWCFGCPALGPLRRFRPNYRMRDRWLKRRAHTSLGIHLVHPSEWMRRRVARTELARLPGSVIPYGIATGLFAPGPGARERLGLPAGPLLLFAGNMYSSADHRKGLPDLLEAFARLREARPDAHLVVAGRVAVEEAPGLIVRGDVAREELAHLHRSADVFVAPSRGDNLPLAVLEAMASGLPVVASSVGGIPEAVAEGVTGLLVPPADPAALAEALASLLADPGRRRAFGVAARERAVRCFSREVSADRHEELYRAIAGAGPRSAPPAYE